ncbi:energy transducer TonB family protein [Hyphomicrobium sp. 2TAF46]|uniref:energy transducer TonB family protein n=1 Tax=Hyphomicrobium sp. 2TAF46 TaxID=3233019 RepID=UPI003F8E4773
MREFSTCCCALFVAVLATGMLGGQTAIAKERGGSQEKSFKEHLSADDQQKVEYYARAVYAKIASWSWWTRGFGFPPGVCMVKFKVAPSGAIATLKIAKSSGNSDLDAAAVKFIKLSNPFPPPPRVRNVDWVFDIPVQFR